MLEDPGESEGQQVLRHLKSIVAWHAAAVTLLSPRSQHLAQDLVVGLVEVTLNKPKLMTDEEVIQEYFRRYPNSLPEDQSFIGDSIRKYYREAKFTGTTHAETTLMDFSNIPPLAHLSSIMMLRLRWMNFSSSSLSLYVYLSLLVYF